MTRHSHVIAVAAALGLGCPGPAVEKAPDLPPTPVVSTVPADLDAAVASPPHSPAQAFAAQCGAEVDRARQLLPAIVAVTGPRTLDNTLVPYNQLLTALANASGMAELMQNVHPDPAVRDAARACEQEMTKFDTEVGLSRPLFEAVSAIDRAGLDADTLRFLDHAVRDFRRNGVDRDAPTRARLTAISERLTQLLQTWQKKIAGDVRKVTVDSAAELAGLPDDFIAAHPPGADGKITITTNYPDLQPVMAYADSAKLRRALYLEFKNRGGEANEQVLREILALRWEKAHLLGYPSWADYITEDKMMKSAKNAARFIDRVVKISHKRAHKDYRDLVKRKRKEKGQKRAAQVEDYEKDYLASKVKAESYAFDPQEARPYFPYRRVEQGLLDITAAFFDITYTPVEDAPVWHPSVAVFEVSRGDKKLGRIYLDMHPRADKFGHAAEFTYRVGVSGVQLPAGVLVCNLPDPTTGPALMEHSDVVLMFHEFGHLMHNLIGGDHRWVTQSGVATEWDFVEAPSQLFEEWARNPETLRRFARHYQTDEPIPVEMVDRMRAAAEFGLGTLAAQQMYYASVSLLFHRVDPAKLDLAAESQRLQTELTPFRYVAGTHFYRSFGHLANYSAMYYTYMWSLVIARDLLTPFLAHGLMDPEWARRYRQTILEPGGTKDAADLVHDFLGRDFNYKAFEKYLGE